MKNLHLALTVIFLFGQALLPSGLKAAQWQLDPGHSAILFQVRHIFSITPGQFTDFTVDMTLDPATPEKGSIVFEVDAGSINTLNTKRDQHLRSGDFFKTSQYPKLSFRSTAITPMGKNKFRLKGELTLKGTTRTIEVELAYLGAKPNPFKPKVTVGGFETRFTINRLDFGVGSGKFYEMGVVDKDVEILISVEMFQVP